MEENIKDYGNKIEWMVMEYTNIEMAENIKEDI